MRRKIETRGSVVLGGAVALAAAGVLRVDGVLLTLGVAAAGWVGFSALFAVWNLRRLRVEVEGPRVVRAGESYRLQVTLRNERRFFDAVGVQLQIRGPGGLEARMEVPWVVAGGQAGGEIRVSSDGRGDGKVLEYQMISVFPWGLVRAGLDGEVGHALTVLPRPIVPVELLEGGADEEKDGLFDPLHRESSGMPRGMREFRAGDRMRDVSWPASLRAVARGTGLVVREWDPPGMRPRQVTLVFHSYAADGMLIRPDRFERAISLAWGAMGHLQAAGVEVRFLSDFSAWVPAVIRSRRELGRLGDRLAGCQREAATERHELEARLDECDGEVWVMSDMPLVSWSSVVESRSQVRVIDVTRFEQGRRLALGGRVHA
ncbi:DUF58 domain-containing protein [Haloferula rosea]|uniref:DUF58 domain-containing protein n=1 Tax=Haloferula rosea TaxID=490093 RepID=A0A934VF22_9BACT|nr:DUF58 domain-containing protein [Haloferula rosea]MBK1826532.1 DUF58 domain-containing protein [Haloferula rosea]